ncbi:unnamed protein product [Arctogadus glacialis]
MGLLWALHGCRCPYRRITLVLSVQVTDWGRSGELRECGLGNSGFKMHRSMWLIQRLGEQSHSRNFTNVKDEGEQPFDTSLLDFLVCPLSKKPLRYEVTTNELINEELGIAYPIIDGIPNMIPQDARLLQKDTDMPADPTQG